jgi:hypothetical protein
MLTSDDKYTIVGRRVQGITGTLVDVGARDRRLRAYLPAHLTYLSTDMVPGHDLMWDLEQPIAAPDQSYDIVVALDVLEHLEQIHQAYKELLRITRRTLFISLPNISCLSWRLVFLQTGHLSGKYHLKPEHQGDRHRWFTTYPQLCAFTEYHAAQAGYTMTRFDILRGYSHLHNTIARLPLPASLRAFTVLFELTRASGA